MVQLQVHAHPEDHPHQPLLPSSKNNLITTILQNGPNASGWERLDADAVSRITTGAHNFTSGILDGPTAQQAKRELPHAGGLTKFATSSRRILSTTNPVDFKGTRPPPPREVSV